MRLMLANVSWCKKERSKNTIDVNNLHKILGHCGEVSARLTGKALGYEVIGTFDACEVCSIGKASRKTSNIIGKLKICIRKFL
jgi:hypothetical protein